MATVPGLVSNILISARATGGAYVSWTPPTSTGGSAITEYLVTCDHVITIPGSITNPNCTVSGLLPGLTYKFSVAAKNSVGPSDYVVSNPFIFPNVPSIVKNVTIVSNPGGQATITWTTPTSDGGAGITGYTVTSSPSVTIPGSITALTATVSGLTIGTAYTFTVAANNLAGTSTAVTLPIYTYTSPPDPVTNVDISGALTNGSFATPPTGLAAGQANLAWSAPAVTGGSPITGYTVTCSDNTAIIPSIITTTSTIISGLTYNTGYVFTIIAKNAVGNSTQVNSSVFTYLTKPGKVSNVQVVKGPNINEVVVSWQPPATTGAIAINDCIVSCNNVSITNTTVNSPTTSVTINNAALIYNASYIFSVTSRNAQGSLSAVAAPSFFYIAAPTVVSNIEISSGLGGTASISWNLPTSDGGSTITRYIITCDKAATISQSITSSPTTVSGLIFNTQYIFSISAQNSAGTSPVVESSLYTYSTIPGLVTNIRITGGVGGQATLTWTAPTRVGNVPIDQYILLCDIASVAIPAIITAPTCIVSGLFLTGDYVFRIATQNTIGTSDYVVATSYKYLTAPGPVTNFDITEGAAGTGTASLTWVPPPYIGGTAITAYVITCDAAGVTISPSPVTSSPATASGLVSGYSYIFSISVRNAAGNSSIIKSGIFKYGPNIPALIVPEPVLSLTVTNNLSVSGGANLMWNPPNFNGGSAILRYKIKCASDVGTAVVTFTTPFVPGISVPPYIIPITGLELGLIYVFGVSAVNAQGDSVYTYTRPFKYMKLPSAPTGVTASVVSGNVVVSWTPVFIGGGGLITSFLVSEANNNTRPLIISSPGFSCTFRNLTQGTSYTFRVVATNSVGNSSPASTTPTSITSVVVPGPPIMIAVSKYSATQARISWVAPPNNGGAAIASYTLAATPSGPTFSGATSPVTISNLTIGTSYVFTIIANNGTFDSIKASSPAFVLSGIPAAPTGLSTSIGNGAVTVSWSASTFSGGLPITFYTVKIYLNATPLEILFSVNIKAGTYQAHFDNLTNGTLYGASVVVNNSIGTSTASTTTFTPLNVPDVVTNIIVANSATSGRATLSWAPPLVNGGASVTSYRVDDISGVTFTTLTTTSKNVLGLVDGTTYVFYVSAINSRGASTKAASIPFTKLSIPSAPTNLVFTYELASVTITWDPVIFGGGAVITSFTVTTYPPTSTISVKSGFFSAKFNNLTAGEVYIFYVIANNSEGSSPAATISGALLEVPDPPTNATVETLPTGDTQISWIDPLIINGTYIEYYTFTSIPSGATFTGNSNPITSSPVLITGLTLGYTYTFTVAAKNTTGLSKAAVTLPYTKVTIPDTPTGISIETVNGTTAIVTWAAQQFSQSGGQGLPITSFTVSTEPITQTITIKPGVFTATFNNLNIGTNYSFSVIANNSVGPSSAGTATKTMTTVSQPPTALSITNNPNTDTRGRALLFWNNPTVTGGSDISGYSFNSSPAGLTFNTISGEAVIASSVAHPLVQPVVIGAMVDGTTYLIKIAVINETNYPSKTALSAPFTKTSYPATPANITCTPGQKSATISWNAMTFSGGLPITKFVVSSVPKSSVITVEAGNFSTILTNLADGTSYTFSVIAYNSTGGSVAGTVAGTPLSIPSVPLSITVTGTGSTAELTWLPPSYLGGTPITSYTISSVPSGPSFAGSTSPVAISGLELGKIYNFSVFAVNSIGNSPVGYSRPFTSSTLPSTPAGPATGNSAIAVNGVPGCVSINYTSITQSGGLPIKRYLITTTPSTFVTAVAPGKTPVLIFGIPKAIEYEFNIKAVNARGSSASAFVTNKLTL